MVPTKRQVFLTGILLSLALGLAFWLIDGVYQYYRFDQNLQVMLFEEPLTLVDAIILNIPQHALATRLFFMVACLVGGLVIAFYVVRSRESQARFQSYIEASPNGVFVADAAGLYLEVNPAACRQTGYSREELLSLHVGDLVDPDWAERAGQHFERVRTLGAASSEFAFRRQDGGAIILIVDAVALPGGRFLGMTTDATAIHAAREREHHLAQVLRGIRNVNQLITQTEDRQALLEGACANLTETLSYYSAWIALIDDQGNLAQLAQSGVNGGFEKLEQQLRAGEWPACFQQSMSRSGVCVIEAPEQSCPECPLDSRHQERAALSMRLAYRERTYGMVAVSVPRQYALDQEEQDLFLELAGDIGFALYKIELLEQRAAAEQELLQYAHIVAASQDGLALIGPDYSYLAANHAYIRLTGASSDEIVGYKVPEMVGQSLFDQLVKPKLDQCLQGETVQWQRWVELPDGKRHFLQVAYAPFYSEGTRPSAVVVRVSDSTNLAETERALLDRGHELEQIIEAIPDAVVFTNNERRITRVNSACTQVMGYTRAEMMGQTTRIFFDDDQADQQQTDRHLDMLTEITSAPREITFRRKNGEIFVGETISTIVRDAANQPIGFLGLVRDINDRKVAEQEHLAIERQMRQAQKMEAVGQLAGGVAHDFNNMLQVIRGYSEFLLDELQPDSQERDYAIEIQQSAERASALTRQLLAFSRRQVLARANLDLDDLVQNLLKMLGRLIGENIDLSFSPAHETLLVNADPGQIEQVLMNLCVNARDAMPQGGLLKIETRRVSLDADFCRRHAWAKEGDYAAVSVADTGCGMDPILLSQVFEPFFTTKGVGQGTGLGLATIYGIIQQHEGLIDVQSQVDQGSTFTCYLPLVSTRDVVETDAESAPSPGGSETILMAEDDPVVRRLAIRLLQGAGYNVIAASDGRQAMELIDQHASHIDLVLLDVIMPQASGSQVYEHYRAQHPTGRVLFMSGYSTGVLGEDFLSSPATTFIAKPFSSDGLLRKIRQVLA